ncbi:2Fe-2S iron-sulfur cluster-binding protein [Shewanella sp. 1_MG-2023]|uniref:(2Fe-2S)-binding protein n=1 Tax=unclassified Shewanella TaxID=196818 RepID=UPI0026E14154|nr:MULTISPECIES: 2Fe-2S iron-sulfur cluster-binding protein [unclassified Shewanella]MDO6611323.1 2Fe-2S iron-sulfur cluster-binding protein [Shewanella sp. 7_MG-2023]MDO6771178.1 2Fe-2S iron-sulfur cluster-binding protein [Shewanella sp. 2_MG-2023]MDO6795859.1 2Fe-2S iron-sulfur cluster-binding protein [Shewanella sp. 1_MG-2023]
MSTLNLTINGKQYGPLEIDPGMPMVNFLHEYLNLTGTKFGCGEGICHACVVIVDNDDGTSSTRRTCIANVMLFNNLNIRTIEGHATKNNVGEIIALHPVQNAFIKNFAFQCGWCAPGFTNETVALIEKLKQKPIAKDQVERVIEDTLGEHVCRCTGYVRYFKAAKKLILATKGLTI